MLYRAEDAYSTCMEWAFPQKRKKGRGLLRRGIRGPFEQIISRLPSRPIGVEFPLLFD
jgi:hypothetical protein